MVYIISYDLISPGQKYQEIHDLIVKISNNRWAHILDSTYIIESYESAEQIFNDLSPALDSNDNIFISEITTNYYGLLPKKYWSYIKELF